MRIKLCLNPIKKKGLEPVLPINYQYEFSSWIYKTLNFGNPEFSDWLHTKGYISNNKQFKLFTFSRLYNHKYEVNKDRMIIKSPETNLTISFLIDKAAESFILGIFKNQKFGIGDTKSNIDFMVKSVEKEKEPFFTETMTYTAMSPIFIDKKRDKNQASEHLTPEHEDYEELFSENLVSKYLAAEQELKIVNINELKLKQLTKAKMNGVLIKAGTPAQTKITGYNYKFELKAPAELQRIGYYAGFGRLNSQGFGCCKII